MDFLEDNLISVKTIEEHFGVNKAGKKLLQIFEMLNKLKFYMRGADNEQQQMYVKAVESLRAIIEEELKYVSSDNVRR